MTNLHTMQGMGLVRRHYAILTEKAGGGAILASEERRAQLSAAGTSRVRVSTPSLKPEHLRQVCIRLGLPLLQWTILHNG